MKLFKTVKERRTKAMATASGEVVFPAKTIYESEMIKETVEYLLDGEGGSTLQRIRYLIANIYNCSTYPNVELFSLLREADQEHQELIMDIIGISQSQYGESCFKMIHDLAPQIIDMWIKEDGQDEED